MTPKTTICPKSPTGKHHWLPPYKERGGIGTCRCKHCQGEEDFITNPFASPETMKRAFKKNRNDIVLRQKEAYMENPPKEKPEHVNDVPPKPVGKGAAHNYYNENKAAIIFDIESLGLAATKKKWGISSSSLNGIKRRWGLKVDGRKKPGDKSSNSRIAENPMDLLARVPQEQAPTKPPDTALGNTPRKIEDITIGELGAEMAKHGGQLVFGILPAPPAWNEIKGESEAVKCKWLDTIGQLLRSGAE